MEDKIVAYIDLLAFSNHVRKNTIDAITMFSNYYTTLHSKIQDNQQHPVDSYIKELQKLAKRTSIDSFEYFIPFSDSVFLVSSSTNDFIQQLSSFLYDCFYITCNFYINPKDNTDPTKTKIKRFKLNGDKIKSDEIDTHYHPTIFRGGIASGEVFPINLLGIIDTKPQQLKSLVGKAVVKAVDLENKIKGPRIILEKDVWDKINEEVRGRYIRKIKNTTYYEILWPAIAYIPENVKSEN